MATYLLSRNQKRWQWVDLDEMAEALKTGELVTTRWSCGHVKRIQTGDRAFIIRLGVEPKGIFASGIVTVSAYEDWHWEEAKAAAGQTVMFIEVQLDTLLNPEREAILPRLLLQHPPFSTMHWDTQMSGVRIPDDIAAALENEWGSFAHSSHFTLPEEVEAVDTLYEGAVRHIVVNAYERNPEARQRCIAHYGTSCVICGFSFAVVYGAVGHGVIHVHHLRPLSEISEQYEVDSVRDLRPVCPNCHTIIHRRQPPYTIEEVKAMLQQAGGHQVGG
jgi:5-methylcytosine-specific restriction protein A